MGLRSALCGLTLLCLTLAPALARAGQISDIAFTGLRRTHEPFLRAVMQTHEGDSYDPQRLARDLRTLRSWEIFRSVDGVATEAPDGSVQVVVSVVERWTLTPIFEFAGASDVIRVEAGLQDSHFLGRAYQLGGQIGFRQSPYQFTPLAAAWLVMPRIGGSDWLSDSRATLDFVYDPLYGRDATAVTMVWQKRLARVAQSLGYRWQQDWLAGITGSFDPLWFEPADGMEDLAPLWPDFVPRRVWTGRLNAFLQWTHLDYREPVYEGWAMSAVPELSLSSHGPAALTWRSQQRGYLPLAHDWLNLAGILRQEYTTARDWERLRVAGGLSGHVRGYPERYFHAQSLISANAELRIKLFQAAMLGAQLKPFFDVAYVGQRRVGYTAIEDHHWARAAGAGVYMWVPQVHLMRLRLDAGWSLEPTLRRPWPYFSFDVAQYF